MAADATELIILKGYAVTGVSVAAEQEIMTKGYGPGAAPPAPTAIAPTSRTTLGVRPSRTGLTVKA